MIIVEETPELQPESNSKYAALLTMTATQSFVIPKEEYAAVYGFAKYNHVKITSRKEPKRKGFLRIWRKA